MENITVGELAEKLKSLEQEISLWAKAGMRTYTRGELAAYEASKTIIDFLESKNLINGENIKKYWVLHAPTEHRTIKESKPFDAKGDATEVFDKVIEKITSGNGDEDDKAFLKKIERRSGIKFINEDTISISEDLKGVANKLEEIKEKIKEKT